MLVVYRFLPFALLACGCVDVSAVRDFASSSGSAVATSEPVIRDWAASLKDAHALALSPELVRAAPDQAKQLAQASADASQYTPMAQKAAQTLTLYFQVLAQLAADKLPDVSAQADSIDKSLAGLNVERAGGSGLAAKGAASSLLKLLSIPLDLWRQRRLGEVIVASDKDVRVLTDFLAATADTIDSAEDEAGKVVLKYYEVSATSTRDPGVRALLRKTAWTQEAATAASRDQAAKAVKAFEAIGRDHAVLAKHAEHLSVAAVKATVAADLPVLEAATKALSR